MSVTTILKILLVGILAAVWSSFLEYFEIGNVPLRVLLVGAFTFGASMLILRLKFKDLKGPYLRK